MTKQSSEPLLALSSNGSLVINTIENDNNNNDNNNRSDGSMDGENVTVVDNGVGDSVTGGVTHDHTNHDNNNDNDNSNNNNSDNKDNNDNNNNNNDNNNNNKDNNDNNGTSQQTHLLSFRISVPAPSSRKNSMIDYENLNIAFNRMSVDEAHTFNMRSNINNIAFSTNSKNSSDDSALVNPESQQQLLKSNNTDTSNNNDKKKIGIMTRDMSLSIYSDPLKQRRSRANVELPANTNLKPVVQVLLLEYGGNNPTKNVAQSLFEDVFGLRKASLYHYKYDRIKLYRCQVDFTCDQLRDWNRLMLGENYQADLKQTVVFQFEVHESMPSDDLNRNTNHINNNNNGNSNNNNNNNNNNRSRSSSSNSRKSNVMDINMFQDYDGVLIVLTPGVTAENFQKTFIDEMNLTPSTIVSHNIHFLNTCPPWYLYATDSEDTTEPKDTFRVEHIAEQFRSFIHNLFPNSDDWRANKSPNMHDDEKINKTSHAMEKLFKCNDMTEINSLFREITLKMLLDIYKFDKFKIGSRARGYKEALERHEFMRKQFERLIDIDSPAFYTELLALNNNFTPPMCQVQVATHIEPQFDPLKIFSKLGWEQLKYDSQLSLIQLYTKRYLFKLNSELNSDYNTVYLTAESLKYYNKFYKRTNANSKMTKIARIVSNGQFGKKGFPNYKAPTYTIDYRTEAIVVEVWTVEYRKDCEDDSNCEACFCHWRYTFPSVGIRMKVVQLHKFMLEKNTRTRRNRGLFGCMV
jgi:hypothetical protein